MWLVHQAKGVDRFVSGKCGGYFVAEIGEGLDGHSRHADECRVAVEEIAPAIVWRENDPHVTRLRRGYEAFDAVELGLVKLAEQRRLQPLQR